VLKEHQPDQDEVHRKGNLNAGAFVGCCFSGGAREACNTAFSKKKSDLIKRALCPFFGLR